MQHEQALDLDVTAENHLHKTLLKDKAISQSPALPPKIASSTRPAQDTASANVTARLYNSNPVKEAMPEVILLIRLAMGLPSSASGIQSGPTRLQALQDLPSKSRSGIEEDGESEFSGLESDEGADGLDVDEDERVAGSDDEDDDFAAFDNRIASSEEPTPEPEVESHPRSITKQVLAYSPSADLSPSPSASPSPPPESRVQTVRKQATAPAPRASASFLPSLTMGGYWSGSDSDAEDNPDLSENDVAPRKNRRGQRARQQIWEKKFGQGAKHLKDPPKGGASNGRGSRDDGWDMKRGAQESGASRGGRYEPAWKKSKGSGAKSVGASASGGNATQVVQRAGRKQKVDNADKPLHPSWEAARRAKEKKVETGTFAGTKVVFD